MSRNVFDVTQKRYKGNSSRKYIQDRKDLCKYMLHKVGDIKLQNISKILDTGCGMGILGQMFVEMGHDVCGIDLGKEAIADAKKRGVKAKNADLEKRWPYKKDCFDLVTSKQVIEHLLNTDYYLEEAYRVLKPGGRLIITTPNIASWYSRIIFMFGYQPFTLEVSTIDKTVGLKFTRKLTPNRTPMGHIRGFTQKALEDILELHHFKTIEKIGGEVNYLPGFMKPFDKFFANIPSLASDLIIIAKK